jgi:hypothetical protein
MIYNILLKPDVSRDIKALLESLYEQYKDLNIEDNVSDNINYELELKIKKINSKEINKNQYLQFIKYLDLYLQKNKDKFVKEIINDEVISYNDYEEDNTSYREIINERESIYMKKSRIENIDFNLQNGLNSFFNYRLSLSKEELIKKSEMKKNSNPFIRKRKRHSYYFKNSESIHTNFRFDLTEINTFKNKTISDISTSYEVEIEFLNFVENNINNDNITRFRNLFQIIKETLGYIIPDNHTLVSYDQYKDTIFKLLENHRDNKPVNIQKKHIDLLIDNKYYATNKLDGVKYNLLLRYDLDNNINRIVLINDRDIWFLYENSTVNQNITTVIFDCEIIESKTSIEMYIFDTIYYSNDENILEKPIGKRLEIYNYIPKTDKLIINKKLYNGDILLNKKTYVYFPNLIDSVKYTIKNMYKNDNFNFNNFFENNDGIIFQPYDTPYFSISQIKDKTKFLPILKWKFPEKVSIDFKIRKNKDNKYKLLSFIYQSNKEVDVEFTDEEGKTYELYLTPEEENILDNDMIIETVFDNQMNKFRFHRIRHDKLRPNSLIPTSRETFIDMKKKFTLSMLIDMLRLNKENIIQKEYTNDNVVIDIRDIDMNKNEQYLFPMIRNVSMLKVTDEGIKNSINYKYIMVNIMNDTFGYIKNYNTNTLNYLDINSYIGSSYFPFYNYFKKSIAIENNKSNFEALKENSLLFNTNKNYLLNIDITELNEKELESVFVNINPNIIFIHFNKLYKNELYMDNNHEISLNEFIVYILKKVPNIILLAIKVIPGYKLKIDRRLPYKSYFNYMNKNVSDVLFLNRCLFIFRKIHNKIKSYLISNFCMNSYSILDIGSGKGGDLPKYKILDKLRTMYLVEPNIDNIKELNDRLATKVIKNVDDRKILEKNYIPFIGSGEDTELISKYVKEKVTNINMFFVLTFFFENEDKLNKLVNTIDTFLDNEGIFVCTFMDGYRTLEILNKEDISNDYYSIKKLSNLNVDTYSNKIEIDFKETQTATKQIEYLVYINILTEKLKEKYIYLEEEHYLDEEYIEELLTNDKDNIYYLEDLNDKEKQLNKLYKYCVYKKILPIDNIEEEKFEHLNPIIIPSSNSQYINEEGLNKNISKPIKLYCNINKNQELICKNNYYRFGAIGTDNNCFFHSYLISSDFYNYNNLNYNEKIIYASQFREDTVDKISRDIFEYVSLGSISYPFFLKEFHKEINMLLSTDTILSGITNFYLDKNYSVNKITLNELRDIFTKYIFYEQVYSVDITNKILYIIDRIENDFYLVKDIKGRKNIKDVNKISYIKELILKTGSKARENCYKDYIKSLLHKRERDGKFKYVKHITNEDIEIFNYILNTNVILISDETLYPITYTNL